MSKSQWNQFIKSYLAKYINQIFKYQCQQKMLKVSIMYQLVGLIEIPMNNNVKKIKKQKKIKKKPLVVFVPNSWVELLNECFRV